MAAPIVKKIIEYMLFKNKEYQNLDIYNKDVSQSSLDSIVIKQSAKGKILKGEMPNFIGLDKRSSYILAQKIGIYLKHRGMGIVVRQNIKKGTPFLKNAVVILDYGPPHYE